MILCRQGRQVAPDFGVSHELKVRDTGGRDGMRKEIEGGGSDRRQLWISYNVIKSSLYHMIGL